MDVEGWASECIFLVQTLWGISMEVLQIYFAVRKPGCEINYLTPWARVSFNFLQNSLMSTDGGIVMQFSAVQCSAVQPWTHQPPMLGVWQWS
jgi:hypothetical protein